MYTNFDFEWEEPVVEEYIGQNTLENQPETLAPKGQFELLALVEDIEREIEAAEGGWAIKDDGRPRLVVYQRVSSDPRRSNNGGDYDYWKVFQVTGLGIEVTEGWSCDIAPRNEYGGAEYSYNCCIGLAGLKRIAQLADNRIQRAAHRGGD
jgi:hypothetical protein